MIPSYIYAEDEMINMTNVIRIHEECNFQK